MLDSMESVFRSKIFWITAIIFTLYLYFKKVVYSYWKRHGIPHDDPVIPIGTLEGKFFLKKITFGNSIKSSYEKFKHHPFHGLYMFHNPTLMVNDPELIKQILVKEFASFCDRGLYFNDKVDPLSGHLFLMTGDRWRTLRSKLSPTLTAGKLKQMFPFLIEIGDEMIKVCDEILTKSDIIELKDLVARYTTDTIFSLAFGFNSNSLKNPKNEFRYYGNLSVEQNPFRSSLAFFAPSVLHLFRIPFNHPKVIKFFTTLFRDMVDQRRMNRNNRNDFLNLLIELMDHGEISEKDNKNETNETKSVNPAIKLEILEAAAQAFVFFVAGFETSSSIVTHCLYELALNPDVQEKLHEEIDDVLKSPEGSNYENMIKMEYLDMVFYETMRKHPSVPFLNRSCINDYQIPNSDFRIPKGMAIIISVSGLHLDPNIYPEPHKFVPERFNKENTAARHPYAYLPFGEGPRICIGKRLGILQSKIALFTLLSNYKFSVCEKTPIPNRYSTNSLLQTPRDGIYLRVEKRVVK